MLSPYLRKSDTANIKLSLYYRTAPANGGIRIENLISSYNAIETTEEPPTKIQNKDLANSTISGVALR